MRSAEEQFPTVHGADADRPREQGCSSSGPLSRSGFLLRDRKLGIRVLGEAKNSASPISRSPARSTRSQQGSPDEAESYQDSGAGDGQPHVSGEAGAPESTRAASRVLYYIAA